MMAKTSLTTPQDLAPQPYLGLQPFREEHRPFFWGRRTHIDQVLHRLQTRRFVAVVGLSGAGKSSLVLAGVIPDLRAGRLLDASSDWVIADMTPATSPVDRLSSALQQAVRKYADEFEVPSAEKLGEWCDRVDLLISRGSRGLVQAVADAGLPKRTQVLVVVDQFEELIRFEDRAKKDEAEGFVQKLLAASSEPDSKIYVVITMRSEFLGRCASYAGLAEAVNEGIYLTPRLNPEQLRDAITKPAKKAGRGIADTLVNRLLLDVKNDEDQLPVLQHALMRCWNKSDGEITVATYTSERIGGAAALDVHANRILKRLRESTEGEQKVKIVEKLFKRITRSGRKEGLRKSEDAAVREAERLGVICQQIGYDKKDVTKVIEEFRKPGRSFLRPATSEQPNLDDSSMIDITHESLIRKWKKLQKWVEEEEAAKQAYLRLVEAAERAGKGESYLPEYDVGACLDFEKTGQWSEAWAERYGGKYKEAIEYLRRSQRRYEEKAARERKELNRRFLISSITGATVAIILLGIALLTRSVSEDAKKSTLAFSDLIQTANEEDRPMEERVPAALGAFWLGGILSRKPYLEQNLPLNTWERFSALQKAESGWPAEPGPTKLVSMGVGGVSTITRDSKTWVASANGQEIQIWSLPSKQRIAHTPFPRVDRLRWSQTGKLLVASSELNEKGTAVVQGFAFVSDKLEPMDGLKWTLDTGDKVAAVSFVENSQTIAVITTNGKLKILPDRPEAFPVRMPDPAKVGQLVFAYFDSTGHYLLVSYESSDSRIVELDRPYKVQRFDSKPQSGAKPSPLSAAAFAKDRSWIVTGSARGVIQVRKKPFKPEPQDDTVEIELGEPVSAVALSDANGHNWIAAGTFSGRAYVFRQDPDAFNGYRQLSILRHDGVITSLGFSDGTSRIVTASEDEKARIFDSQTGLEILRVPHNAAVVFASAFPTDGGVMLLSASRDTVLHLTEQGGNPKRKFDWFPDSSCPPEASGFLEGGEWAWFCNSQLKIQTEHRSGDKDSQRRPGVQVVLTGSDQVKAMTATAEGKVLAWMDQASHDSPYKFHLAWPTTTSMWARADSESIPATFPPSPNLFAISPDGRWLGVAVRKARGQWDVQVFNAPEDFGANNQNLVRTAIPIEIDEVVSVAAGPDGSVAVGGGDGSVQLFSRDGKSTSVHLPLSENARVAAVALAFTREEQLLVGRSDRQIFAVPLQSGKEPITVASNVPASSFVLNSKGTRLAAIAQNHATFFMREEGGRFKEDTSIIEPGTIQALAFRDDNTAITSVQVEKSDQSLVRIVHDLRIAEHRESICDNADPQKLRNKIEEYWKHYDLGSDTNVCLSPASRPWYSRLWNWMNGRS